MTQPAETLFVRGRSIQDLEGAEEFVREFVAWTRSEAGRRGSERQADFDLFVPWLLECVSNERAEGEGLLIMTEIDRIYMEAVWSLCMKGFLRPGPRKVTAPNIADGYGKGYSLTFAGDDWIKG